MLVLDEVRFSYSRTEPFLGPVSLTIAPRQCWAIVGPNGAGKSTLVRLIAGLLKPARGSISFNGVDLHAMSARERARRIAYVPQAEPDEPDVRVADFVLLGRYPHRSLGLFESAEDRRIAEQAMGVTATGAFADRPLARLSAGERQRVYVAAALAQGASVMLLDEPTASLDIQHQLSIFRILRQGARDGKIVIVVTHDVNLAAMFCTDVLLMNKGKVEAAGPPTDVLTPQRLEPVYGAELTFATVANDPSRRWIVPRCDTVETCA